MVLCLVGTGLGLNNTYGDDTEVRRWRRKPPAAKLSAA